MSTGETKNARGTPEFRRASFALFLAGFATFAVLYTVQPLLPIFAQEFAVSPAESSLALSLSTASLALAILLAAILSEGVGRRGLHGLRGALRGPPRGARDVGALALRG